MSEVKENYVVEYLATPYTHASKEVENFRALFVDFVFAELSKKNRIIISPISMGHYAARQFGMPTVWEFWERLDSAILSRCDRLLVLMMPGWQESKGVKAEIQIAKDLNLEISYIDPTPYMMKMIADTSNKALSLQAAFKVLADNMKADSGYAQSWHANLSMAMQDQGCEKTIADSGANNFLHMAFGVAMPKVEKPAPVVEEAVEEAVIKTEEA